MSAGNPKVEAIMGKIRESVKEGLNKDGRHHYNIVYDAIWDLIDRIENLELQNQTKER